MMLRFIFALVAIAAIAPFKPPYLKLDEALAAASSTDKLVATFIPLGAGEEGAGGGSGEAEDALAAKAVADRYKEFFWVRAGDKATQKRIEAPDSGTILMFLDPDGVSVGSWDIQIGGEPRVLKALDEAKAIYKSKPVPWSETEPDPENEDVKKKLIVYGFFDDKKPSEEMIKVLEHPWIARDHGRVIWVRKYVLDSPLAKKFKVTTVPTLVFYDPTQKEEKREMERRKGEVTARQVRAQMRKFFERRKKAAQEGK